LVWGRREDWVRADASPTEVRARAARLAASAPTTPDEPVVAPVMDADGIVRGAAGRWAAVPPIEARLLAPLLDRPGHVVHRTGLQDAGWPAGDFGERTLDGRIKLLRRRITPLGLRIHTVRGLGYLLEVVAPPG
jgi:DNA-binding response OmpR family regulator